MVRPFEPRPRPARTLEHAPGQRYRVASCPGTRTRSGTRRRRLSLMASLIADGHHLDLATLRVLARAKGSGEIILISDASPLAGLPPGVYGEWAVDSSGKIVVAGTPYLAGSNQGLETGLRNLLRRDRMDAGRADRLRHDDARPPFRQAPAPPGRRRTG